MLCGNMIPPGVAHTEPRGEHPRDAEIKDADTRAWWHTTEALSDDGMEGRDTGSAGYQRAADYVAQRFKAAGLKPAGVQAGEGNGYFQSVPLHEVAIVPQATGFTLLTPAAAGGGENNTPLAFLKQITVAAAAGLPAETEAPLTFRGYCGKDAMAGVGGKFVICFGTQRQGLPGGAERAANVHAAGAVGMVTVDDPYFTIEPPRWPYAYARTVELDPGATSAAGAARGAARVAGAAAGTGAPLISLRVDAAVLQSFLAGTNRDADVLMKEGGAKQPLPSFDLPASLRVRLQTAERSYASPNVLALLPGSDPKLRDQVVVVAAHLDGYGFGTPVDGDSLYNGTLDDAAYVALLIQMADDIHAHRLPAPKRSVLFAAFTGEEKGLLGSKWFVDHPTVPLADIAADVNLDQLRPLFPLRILTAEALTDSTLGEIARAVAAPLHIELRPDSEPERNLLRRADQYPFLTKHVPAISFIFGYDPGTDAEVRYREWYKTRYHRPQDDLTQPVDFAAAAAFDTFFYRLVAAIADAPARPAMNAASPFAAGK